MSVVVRKELKNVPPDNARVEAPRDAAWKPCCIQMPLAPPRFLFLLLLDFRVESLLGKGAATMADKLPCNIYSQDTSYKELNPGEWDAVVSQLHISADGKDKLRAATSRHETLQV